MKEFSKNHQLQNAALITAVILLLWLSLFSWHRYRVGVKNTLSEKLTGDIQQASDQSVTLLHAIVDQSFSKLESVAVFFGDQEYDYNVLWDSLMELNDEHVRIGVADTKGILHSRYAAGELSEVTNISDTDYFKEAIQGKNAVSGLCASPKGPHSVVILAVPVYSRGEIIGVVCGEYDTDWFAAYLGTTQFYGRGATMVMEQNGHMVSGFPGMEKFDGFYEMLSTMDFPPGESPETLRARVEAGEGGLFTYSRNGKNRYIYYAPTGIRDWTMISLVLAESFAPQYERINQSSLTLVVVNMILYGLLLLAAAALVRNFYRVARAGRRDVLTQLYNKAADRSMMDAELRGRGKSRMHACLFMDVDRFKQINDSRGHLAGDRLLADLARTLCSVVRESDVVSRFGGDEFCVWMRGIQNEECATAKADEIIRRAADSPGVSLSVGIAFYPRDGKDYDQVTHNADLALYRAKQQGRGRYCVYKRD